MRCPKCSFISFDMVETCVKCGKKIGAAAIELQGTVAGVAPPVFFRTGETATSEASEETQEVGTEETFDLGAEEETDFSFDEEPSAEAETEAVEMDLGEIGEGEEVAPEIDMGLDEDFVEEPEAGFEEEIGISDLSPAEEAEELQPEESLEVVAEEAGAAGGGLGLEDLKVEGIDLDSAPGVHDSGKVVPSVKTGTALDDFDVDLGDLLADNKD